MIKGYSVHFGFFFWKAYSLEIQIPLKAHSGQKFKLGKIDCIWIPLMKEWGQHNEAMALRATVLWFDPSWPSHRSFCTNTVNTLLVQSEFVLLQLLGH